MNKRNGLVALLFSCLVPLGAQAEEADLWLGERLLGQCFTDSREAVRALFGESGVRDENITVRAVRTLKDGSRWMVDRTPGHNFAWFLLQPNKKRQLCLTLFIPAACCVEIKQIGPVQTAIATTQPANGYPTKQATYQRQKGAGVFNFEPDSCLKITYAEEGGETSRQQFSCSNRFYYD